MIVHKIKIEEQDNVEIVMSGKDKGLRIASQDIATDEAIIQYGMAIAISKGIKRGEVVSVNNTKDCSVNIEELSFDENLHKQYVNNLIRATKKHWEFSGYRRKDGKVGTRNYVVVFPLSQCASRVAEQIKDQCKDITRDWLDGIISLSNTEGCGCTRNIQIDRFKRIIQAYICHPNVIGVIAVELGCEQTNIKNVKEYFYNSEYEDYLEKVDFVSIEGIGSVKKTIAEGVRLVKERVNTFDSTKLKREICKFNDIILGTECGGSDLFSGITANRLIGKLSDTIVDNGGSVLLSEVPEMAGTEKTIVERCRSSLVADKFKKIMLWYKKNAAALGESLSDNLVEENINGGLFNSTIKSVGAIIKGGTREIVDVLEYGESIKSSGLNIMQGPGNDMESVTGLVASGANMICFSTGKGTITGSAIVPVIKIPSTTEVYDKMSTDMDFDGERVLKEDVLDEFCEMFASVASGNKTASERNEQFQFQVWTAGKLSV